MIVEVFKCPNCGKEGRVADIDLSDHKNINIAIYKKKIIVICLECDSTDVYIMQHSGTEIMDSNGNVGAVIV